MSNELELLYKKMSELTLPLCGTDCGTATKNRCCSFLYCQEAKRFARDEYGIDLPETDHDDLLFMSSEGCIVPPHLRPICTVHVCCINAYGFNPDDPDWTSDYWVLRDRIDDLEKQHKGEQDAGKEIGEG